MEAYLPKRPGRLGVDVCSIGLEKMENGGGKPGFQSVVHTLVCVGLHSHIPFPDIFPASAVIFKGMLRNPVFLAVREGNRERALGVSFGAESGGVRWVNPIRFPAISV